jgi:hypothetical protein
MPAQFLGGNDLAEALRLDSFQNDLRTLRRFVRRHEFAAVEFGSGIAQHVIDGKNGDHGAQRSRLSSG